MSQTARVDKAFTYSRYAQRVARLFPTLAEQVRATPTARPPLADWRKALCTATSQTIDADLRRMRRELMLRTLVQDLACDVALEPLVADLSDFADLALSAATRAHSADIFGAPTPPFGFSIVAMGKLGAQELNASSDIDIVFICDEPEADAMDNLNLLARRISRTLNQEIDGEFVFRVDTRLRPYGDAGPMVPSLDFLEQYFVAQGRMWERIAWLKSRVSCGPLASDLSALTTPFVFRRYLDFDAVSGMRELHAQLRAEKNAPDNIKLGRGGIRELEFGAQLRQLVRGGRDVSLRIRPTLPALAALVGAGKIVQAQSARLALHYRWLRRAEHVLQYRDDQQTQTLPRSESDRLDYAQAMGFADWTELEAHLAKIREDVAEFFDGTLTGAFGVSDDTAARITATTTAPAALDNEITEARLKAAGYADAATTASFVRATLESTKLRSIPAASRTRFDRLVQAVVDYAGKTPSPDAACKRSLDLLLAVASRSSYLALMVERPQVLDRVIDLASASDWALRYVTQHPLLLDELMDGRTLGSAIDYEQWRADLAARLAAEADDPERAIDAIRHFQQGETFRLLLKDIAGLLPLETLSDHLSALGDAVVEATLAHLLKTAKLPDDARLAVIAYGRWGGKELGYASDLDLIFLMPDSAVSYRDQLTRVAQRLQSWLTTMTAAGRAYDIDVRLRPDGAAGLLLSTVSAFAEYQRDKAWTWEHQALTRARTAAGDVATGAAFEAIRQETIAKARDWPALRDEIIAMRAKVSEGHPNRNAAEWFDIKHDSGGLVDLEFAVQALVLRSAATQPSMRADHGNIALAIRAGELGLVPLTVGSDAANAYRTLRSRQHAIRLQGAERAQVALTELCAERAAIRAFYEAVFG
ncbi:MAG: bifunctional [glutamate--ammonia ligase]-adenylyl-L-tyrosine phosphorylase/[glutamate--ammonia-ligase] adenylyltransferase [Casimicrobium sp.]